MTPRENQITLAFEGLYRDTGSQVCVMLPLTISAVVQLRKSPRKSTRLDLVPKPNYVTSTSWAQLRIFSSRKKEWLEILCIAFDRCHLNQARTRPGTEHFLCSQAQGRLSGRVSPRARPGPCRSTVLSTISSLYRAHLLLCLWSFKTVRTKSLIRGPRDKNL